MNRFQKQQPKLNKILRLLPGPVIFLLLILLLIKGFNAIDQTNSAEACESLNRAIHRSIVHCYATEGSYPESLDYLKENYGITYDENRFFVDYQPIGKNIMPDITVIDLEAIP